MQDYPAMLGIESSDFRLVFGKTRIEYDKEKEKTNRRQHGYSLESAVYLLGKIILPIGNPPFITSESFEIKREIRHMHMGIDDLGTVVLFVTTMRPEETVRIISFRRASEAERTEFERHTGYREPTA